MTHLLPIQQFKQAAIVCSNDAKSCYNRIVHHIMAQSMYRCGVPKPALVCMFTTLQNLQYHVRMLYGDSTLWAGTEIWAVPVARISQGNRAGPQIWAVVSTPILDLLQQEGYGATFQASVSGNLIQFVGYSFVNDTDLIQLAPQYTQLPPKLYHLYRQPWTSGIKACVPQGSISP